MKAEAIAVSDSRTIGIGEEVNMFLPRMPYDAGVIIQWRSGLAPLFFPYCPLLSTLGMVVRRNLSPCRHHTLYHRVASPDQFERKRTTGVVARLMQIIVSIQLCVKW